MGSAVKKIGYYLLGAGVAVSTVLSGVSAAMSFKQYQQMTEYVEKQKEEEAKAMEKVNDYQEDGFVVGEQYEIRSTKAISDAYLSGDASGLSEEDQETLKLAEDVLKEVVKDDMSVYEKELAIYDWMQSNIAHGGSTQITLPGNRGDTFTPHDVLRTKESVCVGYATTFRLFMNMLGLDCHIVHNDYHSWDEVKLDDGEWYLVDIYSDVSGTKYNNFNLSEELMSAHNDWDKSALPKAEGVKYSYANQQIGKNPKTVSLKKLPEKLANLNKKDKKQGYFYLGKKVDDDDLKKLQTMFYYLDSAFGQINKGITESIYQAEDGGYILGVFINDYDYGAVSDLPKEEENEIIKSIEKAFDVYLGELSTEEPAEKEKSGVSALLNPNSGNKLSITGVYE